MANPEDLGRYRLKRLLGRGALGEVWEASDLEQQGTKVAVKIMHAADDELALARSAFAREARLASLMRHPHVVEVYDAGEAAGTSFMVMEMVDGKSLRALMRAGNDAPVAEKLKWLRQIGDGLSAMHRAGVVHRDVKPENVIVRPDRTACLVDLGIAKWTKFDLGAERFEEDAEDDNEFEKAVAAPANNGARRDSQPGIPPVTDYAPPETVEYQLYDELGDQYAWGVLAYELLTGKVPTADAAPLTERNDIPPATAKAIERARSEDRNRRWDGMEALLDELVDKSASIAPATSTPSDAPSTKPSAKSGETPQASLAPTKSKAPDEPAPTHTDTAAPAGPKLPVSPMVLALIVFIALAVLVTVLATR